MISRKKRNNLLKEKEQLKLEVCKRLSNIIFDLFYSQIILILDL